MLVKAFYTILFCDVHYSKKRTSWKGSFFYQLKVRVQLYSLPLYLGTQRTVGGRPLMLKCLPSKCEHCSSRKSLRPCGHGSVLHERNFILRPTQNLPPLLGLEEKGHMVCEIFWFFSLASERFTINTLFDSILFFFFISLIGSRLNRVKAQCQ